MYSILCAIFAFFLSQWHGAGRALRRHSTFSNSGEWEQLWIIWSRQQRRAGRRTSLGAKLVECSLPVSDRAPAEEEADPVSLSFVPFQSHLTAASGAVEIYILDNWAADN